MCSKNAVYALWSTYRLVLVCRELQDSQAPITLCLSFRKNFLPHCTVTRVIFASFFFISPTGCRHLDCSDLLFIFPSPTPSNKRLAHTKCSTSIYRIGMCVFGHLIGKLPKAPQHLCFAFCSVVKILRVIRRKYNNLKFSIKIFGIE